MSMCVHMASSRPIPGLKAYRPNCLQVYSSSMKTAVSTIRNPVKPFRFARSHQSSLVTRRLCHGDVNVNNLLAISI